MNHVNPDDLIPSLECLDKIRARLDYVTGLSGPNEPPRFADGVADGEPYRLDTDRAIEDRLRWIKEELVKVKEELKAHPGRRARGWDARVPNVLDLVERNVDELLETSTFLPGTTPEGRRVMYYARGCSPDPEVMAELSSHAGEAGVCFRENYTRRIPHETHADFVHAIKVLNAALRPFGRAATDPASNRRLEGKRVDLTRAFGPGSKHYPRFLERQQELGFIDLLEKLGPQRFAIEFPEHHRAKYEEVKANLEERKPAREQRRKGK